MSKYKIFYNGKPFHGKMECFSPDLNKAVEQFTRIVPKLGGNDNDPDDEAFKFSANGKHGLSMVQALKEVLPTIYKAQQEVLLDSDEAIHFGGDIYLSGASEPTNILTFKDYIENFISINFDLLKPLVEELAIFFLKSQLKPVNGFVDVFGYEGVYYNDLSQNKPENKGIHGVFSRYRKEPLSNKGVVTYERFCEVLELLVGNSIEQVLDWLANAVTPEAKPLQWVQILQSDARGCFKTVLAQLFQKVVGSRYSLEVAPEENKEKFNSEYGGKRFIFFEEAQKERQNTTALFQILKALTTGKGIKIKAKFKNAETYPHVAQYMFCTNNSDAFANLTQEEFRRIFVLNLVRSKFTEKENSLFFNEIADVVGDIPEKEFDLVRAGLKERYQKRIMSGELINRNPNLTEEDYDRLKSLLCKSMSLIDSLLEEQVENYLAIPVSKIKDVFRGIQYSSIDSSIEKVGFVKTKERCACYTVNFNIVLIHKKGFDFKKMVSNHLNLLKRKETSVYRTTNDIIIKTNRQNEYVNFLNIAPIEYKESLLKALEIKGIIK